MDRKFGPHTFDARAGRQPASSAKTSDISATRWIVVRGCLTGHGSVTGHPPFEQQGRGNITPVIVLASADPGLFEVAADQFGGSAQAARAYLAEPGTVAFVATAGDEVVGWCWGSRLARPDGTFMLYMHELEVSEVHRRRGFGRALLQAFMAVGRSDGAAKMFLITGEANTAAQAMYHFVGGRPATQGATVSYWFPL